MRLPRRTVAALVLALFLAAGVAVALAHDHGESTVGAEARPAPSAWRGLVGTKRPSVALGQRVIVLLDAPSLADRVREAGGTATDAQQRRWTAAALAGQQQLLSELATRGVIARPDLRFTRVVNGFSAVADPRAVVLLERAPEVAGVYPVRAGFPATIAAAPAAGATATMPSGLAAFPGRGVTVALLDTAVDPATPYLHGRVLPGFDVVSGGAAARYDQRPGGTRLETHGTEIAGLIVGHGGPGTSIGSGPRSDRPADSCGGLAARRRRPVVTPLADGSGDRRSRAGGRPRPRRRSAGRREDRSRAAYRAVRGVCRRPACQRRLGCGCARLSRRGTGGQRRPRGSGLREDRRPRRFARSAHSGRCGPPFHDAPCASLGDDWAARCDARRAERADDR